MTQYTFNEKTYYYEVFKTKNDLPFIVLSQKEKCFDGLFKMYFLQKYSIKYAMEDFEKYEDNVNAKNAMQKLS